MKKDADALCKAPGLEPVERIEGGLGAGVLFLCDHASNALPAQMGTLGLPPGDLQRHIAFDIGAASVTRRLAERFKAPALLAGFSRLLIDPNRGLDDPTLVMRLSDGRIIPGNARLGTGEIERRIHDYWRPYRGAISALLEAMMAHGPVPAIVSVHSFTPKWREVARPWEVGVLWDCDQRFARPLIAALRDTGFTVGDNEPYDGALKGDTLDEEVTRRGLAGLLLEIRQDLISARDEAQAFADRIAAILDPILACPDLRRLEFAPSRTGRHAVQAIRGDDG
jgi:predicted N-formylglutamate amidohydrolase